MKRIAVLLLLLLLTLGSMAGYFFLNERIIDGSLKIAAGQKQLAEGEQMLARGKTRLVHGEQELSAGKKTYSNIKDASMGIAAVLPVTWLGVAVAGNQVAGGKIAEGDRLVAQGKKKVKAGEKQLEAGKQELRQGIERLNQAKKVRLACAIGAIFFTCLLILLGAYWGPAAAKTFKKK